MVLLVRSYRIHVCDICGMAATAQLKKQQFECSHCRNKTEVSQVHLPYAAKLLFQEVRRSALPCSDLSSFLRV
jgi:DNA-directed RNA polymerase II subunit RPB2